jgi:urease accessory protein
VTLLSSSHWHGKLQLTFAWTGDSTQLVSSRVQAPLKVQRPFYPEGPQICHSVLLHTAGGIVGGDRLSLSLDLQPQAQALITTAAASKIYRTNGQTAHQTIQINLAEQSWLEWLPQETIVFNGAVYRQSLRIELAPGACWLGWEITRFGRSARGEQFTQGDWRSHTEVWQAGRPLWVDRQWMPGSQERFHSPHGLAGCPVVGSFAFVGQPIAPELIEQARQLGLNAGSEMGVTRLQSGFLCRYRGTSTAEVCHWFVAVWRMVRLAYGDRELCLPRVWQW